MSDIFQKCFEWPEAKQAREAGFYPYFRVIEESEGTEVVIDGKKMLMLGSNNYLGLTHHPKVRQASIEATERFGPGCTGSRFLNGTISLHVELEDRLARFLKKEAALCFSTGFQTNLGTVGTLLGRGDVVFADRSDHASIVDGMIMSGAEVRRFRHNEPADLERKLAAVKGDPGKLIVVDGVFSMEGDIAPVPELVRLKKKYGARLMVDDAHGLGVLGEKGCGTGDHFGMQDEVDLVMGTFSKSFASLGGVIAGPADVIDWLKHKARPMIFSASMTPGATAAALAALDVMETEPEHLERLWRNATHLREGLQALGYDTGKSETPVIPVYLGDDMRCFLFWRSLGDAGLFTNPVVAPAVPPGHAMLRTSVMASHTLEQLDEALAIFERVGRETGVLPAKGAATQPADTGAVSA